MRGTLPSGEATTGEASGPRVSPEQSSVQRVSEPPGGGPGAGPGVSAGSARGSTEGPVTQGAAPASGLGLPLGPAGPPSAKWFQTGWSFWVRTFLCTVDEILLGYLSHVTDEETETWGRPGARGRPAAGVWFTPRPRVSTAHLSDPRPMTEDSEPQSPPGRHRRRVCTPHWGRPPGTRGRQRGAG